MEFGGLEVGEGRGWIGGVEVVYDDAIEVGDDDVLGEVGGAAFAGEGLDVVEGLRGGFREVLAFGLVLAEHDARVEDVDAVVLAFEVADLLFEGGDGAALHAEDGEEFGPEGLGVGAFVGTVAPLGGEADRVGADLGLGESHGSSRGSVPGRRM